MSLDSNPPKHVAEKSADDFELPIEGFTGTPEEIERQWFDQVYRGRGDSMKQLTWRAVLMGSVLGAVLSLTNLYIGLKVRLGHGRGHHGLHPVLRHLDDLRENRPRQKCR